MRCAAAVAMANETRSDYLQGRASASQLQPVPEREQPIFFDAARLNRAQARPYSRSVKSCQEAMAARCAAAFEPCEPLLP